MSVPVLALSSVDPVLRESAASSLLCDVPDVVVLRHDLLPEAGQLRRVVYDRSGTIEDVLIPLEHTCLSCALREDIIPTLEQLALRGPEAIILALPVAADAIPVIHALSDPAVRGLVLAAVACTFDAETLVHDALGDDLLEERGLALTADDARSVGEALVPQIEYADILLVAGELSSTASALLDHLVLPTVGREPVHAVDTRRLLARRRETVGDTRGDPRAVRATGAAPRDGVWTLDLQSWRPLHHGRLMDNLERLATGSIRARGHFWLPTRPDVVCLWDGAGGQLSIGEIGTWDTEPQTHLVITGIEPDPVELLVAFEESLMSDSELAAGLASWSGRDDGFDPWLGERHRTA